MPSINTYAFKENIKRALLELANDSAAPFEGNAIRAAVVEIEKIYREMEASQSHEQDETDIYGPSALTAADKASDPWQELGIDN